MSICPTCGHRNPEGAPLCETCGARLEAARFRLCPACGARNAVERTYCSRCLSPLAGGGPAGGPEPGEDLDLDPLAGLEGLLPAPQATPPYADMGPEADPAPRQEEAGEAALLRRIATEAAPLGQARHEAFASPPRRPSPGLRRLLYLLVLLAALAPLFTHNASRSWGYPRPQVVSLAERLADIPGEGRVLVAFDYGPAYGGELNPLAEQVLADLASRGTTLVAVGTHPESVGVARQVLARAVVTAPDYAYGGDYVVLGYLPGEDRGLRLLTQDLASILPHDDVHQMPLASLPIMRGVGGLDDFCAILLLSDEPYGARRWIEQVSGQTATPTYALVTARLEPMLAPYLQSGQLAALVTGACGAIEYPLAGPLQPSSLCSDDGYLALWGVLVLTAVLANVGRQRKAKGA